MKYIIIPFLLLSLIFSSCQPKTGAEETAAEEIKAPSSALLFIGNYTPKAKQLMGNSGSIYVYEMSLESGALSAVDTIESLFNPSYLAIHPNEKHLYAISELINEKEETLAKVTAFAIDKKQKSFKKLNMVSAQGDGPCHIEVSPNKAFVMVANYASGNIAAMPIQADGSLAEATSMIQHEGSGPNESRQKGPHAHMVKAFPGGGNNFVSVDLGMDQVLQYQLEEESGQIRKVGTTSSMPGSGPRHLDFHPQNPWCYVLNELNHTIEVFLYEDIATSFERIQTISTLEEGSAAKAYPAAIKIHPNGRFLYASNRGETEEENSIAMFKIAPQTGQLTFLGVQHSGGVFPRDFEIDPSGAFLLVANQRSDNVIVYRIDSQSGLLEDTGAVYEVPIPVCLKFLAL